MQQFNQDYMHRIIIGDTCCTFVAIIPILKCTILQCPALLDLRARFTYKEGVSEASSLLVIIVIIVYIISLYSYNARMHIILYAACINKFKFYVSVC